MSFSMNYCCSSGGMFVQLVKFVEEHEGKIGDIFVYGQESIPTTWRLAKMNFPLRGIDGNLGLKTQIHFMKIYKKTLKADFIYANEREGQGEII